MSRLIAPIILIAITIAVFLTFTMPFYADIGTLRISQASYNEALNNSKALENERDKLVEKENNIGRENMDKLNKLLPENVDNIRLILEIEQVALPYGMALKDVKYSSAPTTNTSTPQAGQVQGGYLTQAPRDYGVWDLEFSTTGTYNNFLSFISDLEHNLRIVDIASVVFSSNAEVVSKDSSSSTYQYKFKIKTYWLKN